MDRALLNELREALSDELGGLDKANTFLEAIENQDVSTEIEAVIELTTAMNNALITIGAIHESMAPDWNSAIAQMNNAAAEQTQSLIEESESDLANATSDDEYAGKIPQLDVGQSINQVTNSAKWLEDIGIDAKLWLVLNFWVEFNREAAQSMVQTYIETINSNLSQHFAVTTMSDDDFNDQISQLLNDN